MPGSIHAPIFVQYTNGKLIAFDETYEAELLPNDHLPLVESVWDALGHKLRFEVKQQYALRVVREDDEVHDAEFRSTLVAALQDAGDISTDRLSTEGLVDRALAQFRVKEKETDWGSPEWGRLFVEVLLHVATGVTLDDS